MTTANKNIAPPLPLLHSLGIEDELLQEREIPIFDLRGRFPSIHAFAEARVAQGIEKESFLVFNVAYVLRQWEHWQKELPMVHPFYAVKTNPDPVVLRLLAQLGFGFDCASQGEIDLITHCLGERLSFANNGRAAQSIVYAHPAKAREMIKYAIENNVTLSVVDGEDELRKIASMENHEKLRLLIRISVNDEHSRFAFSKKFGVPVDHALELLQVAKELGLSLVGVSFHVGSGCRDAEGYTLGLRGARVVFDEWEEMGMPPMHVVDIGGGFSGDYVDLGPTAPKFEDLAAAVRSGIEEFKAHYKHGSDALRFIAEPGRFFVSDSTTLATRIIARKGGQAKFQSLYVDDGVYSNLNNIILDFAKRMPTKMKLQDAQKKKNSVSMGSPAAQGEREGEEETPKEHVEEEEELIHTAVFGQTCDCLDQMCQMEDTLMPRCEENDWLLWDTQGAYTHTASFVFNGFTHVPQRTYCFL